jgi:hypothetical protein
VKSNGLLNTVYVVSALIGVFLVVSGTTLVFFKPVADVIFGVSGSASMVLDPLSSEMGIRQLALGLIIFLLAVFREKNALGITMTIGWLVPLLDFVEFSHTIGVVSALRHGIPVPIVLGAGILLLTVKKKES